MLLQGHGKHGMTVLNTTYFGSVDWYRQIACADEDVVYIEAHENYIKQTERNRCAIATANGRQNLSVPVSVPAAKCLITEVLVSDHGNWRHNHWEALKSAYGMSPFFDFYQDDIRPLFEPNWNSLFDYNMAIANRMLKMLGIDKKLASTDTFKGNLHRNPDVEAAGVGPYYQTFQRRHGFIPHLSILDLLFNEGPEAIVRLTD